MRTIIIETEVPYDPSFPPSWPHKVLQAAVAMRAAYAKAGRAGSPSPGDLEALGDALLDAATAELGEVIVPSSRLARSEESPSSEAITARGGRLDVDRCVDPFDLPEVVRGDMDEPIIFGRAEEP